MSNHANPETRRKADFHPVLKNEIDAEAHDQAGYHAPDERDIFQEIEDHRHEQNDAEGKAQGGHQQGQSGGE